MFQLQEAKNNGKKCARSLPQAAARFKAPKRY